MKIHTTLALQEFTGQQERRTSKTKTKAKAKTKTKQTDQK